MKYRILSLFIALLALPFNTAAQKTQSSLLWKITGKDLHQPSYLYGTLHLLCVEDVKFSDAMKAAMDSSRALYLELKFDDPSLTENMQKLMQGPQGYSLQKIFSPADYSLLQQYATAHLQADISQFDQYKPILPMILLLQGLLPCTSQSASMDLDIMTYMKGNNRPVMGLETVAEQMHAIDEMPDSEMVKSIMEMVREPDKQKDIYARMRQTYLSQDLDKLAKVSEEDKSDALETVLLKQRNEHWVPIIDKVIHTQSTFIAFGALHLTGENGIIALLRKQGYTVTPVR